MKIVKLYIKNILVAFDRLLNTIFGGSSLETISSRLARYRNENKLALYISKLINKIFFWQKDHIGESLEPADHSKDDILK